MLSNAESTGKNDSETGQIWTLWSWYTEWLRCSIKLHISSQWAEWYARNKENFVTVLGDMLWG